MLFLATRTSWRTIPKSFAPTHSVSCTTLRSMAFITPWSALNFSNCAWRLKRRIDHLTTVGSKKLLHISTVMDTPVHSALFWPSGPWDPCFQHGWRAGLTGGHTTALLHYPCNMKTSSNVHKRQNWILVASMVTCLCNIHAHACIELKNELVSYRVVTWLWLAVFTCLATHKSSCFNQLRRGSSCLQDGPEGLRCRMWELTVQSPDCNPGPPWQSSPQGCAFLLIHWTWQSELVEMELFLLHGWQTVIKTFTFHERGITLLMVFNSTPTFQVIWHLQNILGQFPSVPNPTGPDAPHPSACLPGKQSNHHACQHLASGTVCGMCLGLMTTTPDPCKSISSHKSCKTSGVGTWSNMATNKPGGFFEMMCISFLRVFCQSMSSCNTSTSGLSHASSLSVTTTMWTAFNGVLLTRAVSTWSCSFMMDRPLTKAYFSPLLIVTFDTSALYIPASKGGPTPGSCDTFTSSSSEVGESDTCWLPFLRDFKNSWEGSTAHAGCSPTWSTVW